jgi:hypothetical protein
MPIKFQAADQAACQHRRKIEPDNRDRTLNGPVLVIDQRDQTVKELARASWLLSA